MRSSVVLPSIFLLVLTGAQNTVTGLAMSEIQDGQPQAPTGTAGGVPSGSKTGAPAGSPTNPGGPEIPNTPLTGSSPYSNPFTYYTSQTNSLGVITGQPSPVTSQPSLVTSQPSLVTSIPSVSAPLSSIATAPGPVVLNSTTAAGGSGNGTAAATTSTGSGSSSTLATTTTGSGSTSPSGSGSGSSAAPTSGSGSGAGMVQVGMSAVMVAAGFAGVFFTL